MTVTGQGLHTAAPARVTFARAPGPVRIGFGRSAFMRAELAVASAERSTKIAATDGSTLGTVEHLFGALAGLSLHEGVRITVEGPEVPLVDGAAGVFASALQALALPAGTPTLRVVRAGEVVLGNSRYRFEPHEGIAVHVEVDFGDARLAPSASWHGDAGDFVARIAPARTFGFAREVEELAARGLASHVAPESVVVIDVERIHSAGAPFTPDEPARHKLLDLLGDLWLHGGPPLGHVFASAPGHARTHAAVAEALARGLVATA